MIWRGLTKTLRLGRFFFPCALAWGLTACQSGGPMQTLGPWGASLQALWSEPPVHWDRLSDQYDYLLLRLQGRDAVMVQGGRGAAGQQDWFSARREWLRLQGGRIVGLQGMGHDWHAVRGQPPDWAQVDAAPLRWTRERDVMPGYRFGVVDQITTRVGVAPTSGLPPRLQPQPHWRWYEEDVQSTDAQGQPWAFTQRFALAQGQVVYSEQCVAPQWCLQMMPRAAAGAGR